MNLFDNNFSLDSGVREEIFSPDFSKRKYRAAPRANNSEAGRSANSSVAPKDSIGKSAESNPKSTAGSADKKGRISPATWLAFGFWDQSEVD